jgi:hypothetical protein
MVRTAIALSVITLLLSACGQKEEAEAPMEAPAAAPAEADPAPEAAGAIPDTPDTEGGAPEAPDERR